VLGNCLAILLGIPSGAQSTRILDYIKGAGLDSPFPVRSLDHPIQRGDPDWRDYLLLRNLNKPFHYHNGGIWPFLGGFYVSALVAAGRQDYALDQLIRLTELNRQGVNQAWEFNEWAHGQSGRPMGFARQSWSAAMYIFAYDSVMQANTPYFNTLRVK
jgi:glycogen debranching enzyme